jgi:GNAT superfamily N-acetyltransferase
MDYLKDSVFIATFAGKPVAMFALLNHEFHRDLMRAPGAINLPHALELMYVYVEKDYRGLGFGRQIIHAAKRLAHEMGAERIQLDTLKPGLNRMYEKQGAEQLCEHHLFSHSTDVFTMKI